MMTSVLLSLLVLFARFNTESGERILVLPYPVYSHCNTHASVGEAMAKRGHSVFIYLPTNFNSGPCIKGKGMTSILYTIATEDWDRLQEIGISKGLRQTRDLLLHHTRHTCKGFFQNRQQLDNLLLQKFDFAIVDPFYGSRCFLYFVNKNRIPYATVSPAYILYETGAPFIPNIYPHLSTGYPPSMTLLQRTINTIMSIGAFYLIDTASTGDVSKEFLPEVSVSEYRELVQNRASLYIQDDSMILSGALPVTPNTVHTGGFSAKPAKSLPDELKEFFNNAENGIIVVSFGSVLRGMAESTHKIFDSVFKRLPYNILWKYGGTSKHKNILKSNWIPQNDAVGHNHTKLFITHCGLNSVYEGVYHAVPMLCVPHFGDQFRNAEVIQRKGFGLKLEIETVSEEELKGAILNILSNNRFRLSLEKASELYRVMHPIPAAETAATAIEHVMKFGGEHLRPVSLDLSMLSFVMLDVWLVIFTAVGIFICSLLFFIRCLWRLLRKYKTKRD